MSTELPHPDQSENKYYEHYRHSLINRHICENGRYLQEVLLVEQDPLKSPPHAIFHENRRHCIEYIPNHIKYEYSGYPVIVEDDLGYGDGKQDYIVGGGDNPLLQGGLAMATFALEELLDISNHSFEYASLLLDYFLDSEMKDAKGNLVGFPLRRRHWWQQAKEISKDELCGFLLGMHFFIKAAVKRGDMFQKERAVSYLVRMGKYLKDRDYAPAGAWLFQFPFTRVFKYSTGKSFLSGTTFPDDWGPLDDFLGFAGSMYSLFSLDFDFNYKPQDLFRDSMEWLPECFGGAKAIEVDSNFYNLAMYLHAILMIHDNPVNKKFKKHLWGAFKGLFDYFGKPGNSIGQGEGRFNAYLGLIAHVYAKSIGKEDEVDTHAKEMYSTVLNPKGIWWHDLPLCGLPKWGPEDENGNIRWFPGASVFQYLSPITNTRFWGEWFTWEHSESHGHDLNWDWDKTLKEIGPTYENKYLLLDHLVQGKYYHAKLENGFRVEAAGMGLLFPRVLAAYYGLAPKPQLENDIKYKVLPIKGPTAYGTFLANTNTMEVHDYQKQTVLCQIHEIKAIHKKWYKEIEKAYLDGFDNCAYCIGDSHH